MRPPAKRDTLRLDKLLFFLRLARTRSLGQVVASAGHVRIGGIRIERAAHGVAVGDVVTVPLGSGVLVFELLALPVRRGPPSEARACYRLLGPASPGQGPLDDVRAFAIAASETPDQITGAIGSPQQ